MSPIPVAIELRARTASFKWQVSPLLYILFPGIGLGLSLRVKCPARVPLAGQHSSVAVARNVLHLEAVPLTERSTSLCCCLIATFRFRGNDRSPHVAGLNNGLAVSPLLFRHF